MKTTKTSVFSAEYPHSLDPKHFEELQSLVETQYGECTFERQNDPETGAETVSFYRVDDSIFDDDVLE